MYYHNELDPDGYGWPGDNSKSTSLLLCFFFYFLLSSSSSLSVIHPSHSSVIPLLNHSTKSFRSFLISIFPLQNFLQPFVACLVFPCLLFPGSPELIAHTHMLLSLTLPLGSLIQPPSCLDNNCCSAVTMLLFCGNWPVKTISIYRQ